MSLFNTTYKRDSIINDLITCLDPYLQIIKKDDVYYLSDMSTIVSFIVILFSDNSNHFIPVSMKEPYFLAKDNPDKKLLYVFAFKDGLYSWEYDEKRICIEFDYNGSEYCTFAKNFLIKSEDTYKIMDTPETILNGSK